jgi:DNA-binding CsgD family transcriptional regulator
LDVAPATCIDGLVQTRRGRSAHAYTRQGGVTQLVDCREHIDRRVPNLPPSDSAASAAETDVAGARLVSSESAHRLELVLRQDQTAVAAFYLERSEKEACFSAEERARVEHLGALLASAVVAQVSFMDAECELAAVRSIGSGLMTYLVFDRAKRMVVWGSQHGRPLSWTRDVEPCESSMVLSAERLLGHTDDDVLPTPTPVPVGMLVAANPILTDAPFGRDCAVMGFRHILEGQGAIMNLSDQERMVARMLVRGYQPLNIAAQTGISEHTVRTYVRRMYKKLGVSSRADLVRLLLTEG